MRSGVTSSARVGWNHASDLPDRSHGAGREPRDVIRPRTRSENESLCLDRSAVGPDPDAVLALRPLEHALARTQRRAALESALDVRDDAPLGDDEPAVRLVHDLHLGRQVERGEARCHLGAGQHLVLDAVDGAGVENAVEDLGAALDDPGRVQEVLTRLVLELAPELVRTT